MRGDRIRWEGSVRRLWIPELFWLEVAISHIVVDPALKALMSVLIAATVTILFFRVYRTGERLWPACLLAAAAAVWTVAELRPFLSYVERLIVFSLFVLLCGIATVPPIWRFAQELWTLYHRPRAAASQRRLELLNR